MNNLNKNYFIGTEKKKSISLWKMKVIKIRFKAIKKSIFYFQFEQKRLLSLNIIFKNI